MQFNLLEIAQRQGFNRSVTILAGAETTQVQHNALARIHRDMLAPWLNSRSAILEAYDRELRRTIAQDAVADLEALFGSIGDEVGRLILDLGPDMVDWSVRQETWHRTKWTSSVLAGTEVDISAVIGPAGAQESLDQFLARNTNLIRNVSDDTRKAIGDLVYRGLQQRTPPRQVGAAITKQLGLSRRRANRIAADQAVKLSAALDRQRQREAGLEFWKWRHSGKVNFRPDHRARDGRIYNDQTAPADEPGVLPYCGCIRQGVLLDEEAAARYRKDPTGGKGPALQEVPTRPRQVEPAAPPAPVASDPAQGFRSPINPDVNVDTIEVRKRLELQRELTAEFAQAATHAAYRIAREFKSRRDADFGKASLGTAFTDEAASAIRAIKPELDDLADQIGIPRLRGFKTITGRTTNADMGDGVMGIKAASFNEWATGLRARTGNTLSQDEIDAIRADYRLALDETQAISQQIRNTIEQFHNLSPADPQRELLKSRRKELLNQHTRADKEAQKRYRALKAAIEGLRRQERAEGAEAATWRPGDDPKKAPWSVKEYTADGIDQMRSLLFHEFGHHVHQYLGKEGHRREFGSPPLERDLVRWFRMANKDRMLSRYGRTSKEEWFAENFSAYVMGRRDLLDEGALELIEGLFKNG